MTVASCAKTTANVSMTGPNALTPLSDADYESIEQAVVETERGRWFLSEYARRNRNADTEVLLSAINRLEGLMSPDRSGQGLERLRFDLIEMAKAISRTKNEISAIIPQGEHAQQSRLGQASGVLDGIVRSTEKATQDILESAERMQEVAWTLRENGADSELCDSLDRHATNIYTACSFQDLTSQRIVKVVHVLRYLEARIHAMIEIWDQTIDDSPSSQSTGTSQNKTEQSHAPDSLIPYENPFNTMSQNDIDDVIVDQEGLFTSPPVDVEEMKVPEYQFRITPPVLAGPILDMDVYVQSETEVDTSDLIHLADDAERTALDEAERTFIDMSDEEGDEFFIEEPFSGNVFSHDISQHDQVTIAAEGSAYPHDNKLLTDDAFIEQSDASSEPANHDTDYRERHTDNPFDGVEALDFDASGTAQKIDAFLSEPFLSPMKSVQEDRSEPFEIDESGHTLIQAEPSQNEQASNKSVDNSDDIDAFAIDTRDDVAQSDETLVFDLDDSSAWNVSSSESVERIDNAQSTLSDDQTYSEVDNSAPETPVDPRKAAFAAIDQLDTMQKLSRFS